MAWAATPASAQLGQGDTLQAWLALRANPIRSLDAADEDYRDLEPLGRAVGAARVVQLGEPGHGAGASFAAKVRLIKFLHQRMGFDLLVWESGFHDVELAQEGMRGADDGVAAARRGVFTLWSMAREVRPLFDYVKASHKSPRPLDMAGFDLQVTANGSVQRFAADLRGFIGALRDGELRAAALRQAEQAILSRDRLFAGKFADQAEFDAFLAATDGLSATLDRRRAAFEAALGAIQTEFMERAVGNMRIDAQQRHESARGSGATVARENRRDARNADNLRWLLERKYPGRKAIVWAHNAHVMNAWYKEGFRDISLEPATPAMKPTGIFLTDWLGEGVYTIGMTAYEGEDAFATGGPRTAIAPASTGSLEERLHRLGHPVLFLNLRLLDEIPGHGLRLPQSVRIPKYAPVVIPDMQRVYDGIVFIDRMTPATRDAAP